MPPPLPRPVDLNAFMVGGAKKKTQAPSKVPTRLFRMQKGSADKRYGRVGFTASELASWMELLNGDPSTDEGVMEMTSSQIDAVLDDRNWRWFRGDSCHGKAGGKDAATWGWLGWWPRNRVHEEGEEGCVPFLPLHRANKRMSNDFVNNAEIREELWSLLDTDQARASLSNFFFGGKEEAPDFDEDEDPDPDPDPDPAAVPESDPDTEPEPEADDGLEEGEKAMAQALDEDPILPVSGLRVRETVKALQVFGMNFRDQRDNQTLNRAYFDSDFKRHLREAGENKWSNRTKNSSYRFLRAKVKQDEKKKPEFVWRRAWEDSRFADARKFFLFVHEEANNLKELTERRTILAKKARANDTTVKSFKRLKAMFGERDYWFGPCSSWIGCMLPLIEQLSFYIPDAIFGTFVFNLASVLVYPMANMNTMFTHRSDILTRLRKPWPGNRANYQSNKLTSVEERLDDVTSLALVLPKSFRESRQQAGLEKRQARMQQVVRISKQVLIQKRVEINDRLDKMDAEIARWKDTNTRKETQARHDKAGLLTVLLMMNTGMRRGDILSITRAEPVSWDQTALPFDEPLAEGKSKRDKQVEELMGKEEAVDKEAAELGQNTRRVMLVNWAKTKFDSQDRLGSMRYLLGGASVKSVQDDLEEIRDLYFTKEIQAQQTRYWRETGTRPPRREGRSLGFGLETAEKSVTKIFNQEFNSKQNRILPNPHALRAAYAAEAFTKYRRGDEDRVAFVNRLFNHKSYQASLHYMFVRVTETDKEHDASTLKDISQYERVVNKLEELEQRLLECCDENGPIIKKARMAAPEPEAEPAADPEPEPDLEWIYERKRRSPQEALDYVESAINYLQRQSIKPTWTELRLLGFGAPYLQAWARHRRSVGEPTFPVRVMAVSEG